MAGFLRKKPKTDGKQGKPTPAPPNNTAPSISTTSAVTPLYAKFATSSPVKQDVSSTTASRRMVSGPMSLASARKGGHERQRSGAGAYGNPKGYGNGLADGNNGSGLDVRSQKLDQPGAPPRQSWYLPADEQTSPNGKTQSRDAAPTGSRLRPNLNEPPLSGSASLASLDKPLPSPSADPATTAKERRLSKNLVPGTPTVDKPLPVPVSQQSPSPAWLGSNIPVATSSQSPYPDTRRKETTTPNVNTNTSPNMNPLPRYPNAPTQYQSSKANKDLPSQPSFNPYLSSNTNGTSASMQPPRQSTLPAPRADPSPLQFPSSGPSHAPTQLNTQSPRPPSPPKPQPPSPKKSQFPTLSRLSFSRSKSPPKPSPESGPVSRSSSDRPSLDRRGSSQAGTGSPPKDKGIGRISLDDPKETRDGFDLQSNKAGYVTSIHSRDSSVASRPKRIGSQSTGHTRSSSTTSSKNSLARRNTNQPQTSFGDFWLPQKPRRSSASSSRTAAAPSPTTVELSTSVSTTGSSAHQTPSMPHSSGHHDPFTPSNPTNPPHPSYPDPTTNIPTYANPPRPPNPPISLDPPNLLRLSSPLVVHEELREYTDLIQNMGATGLSPAPAPAPMLPIDATPFAIPAAEPAPVPVPVPEPFEEVRRVPLSKPTHVAHARQTSIQMRKGPLIFATAPGSDEASSERTKTPPKPATSQLPPNVSKRPNFAQGSPGNMGLGAYPSPPTEFSSLVDESFGRQPRQGPPSTTALPVHVNKPHERLIQNFSVPRRPSEPRLEPQQQQQQQPHPQYRLPAQGQPPPSQIPRFQMPPAQPDPQSQSRPHKSQTLVQPLHQTPNDSPLSNSRSRPSSELQPKHHRVLTKSKQPSAPASKPATPPTSPPKPTRRLEPPAEFDRPARPRSGVSSNANSSVGGQRPDYPDIPDMDDTGTDTPGRQPSQQDLGGQPHFNPLAATQGAKVNVDLDTNMSGSPPFRAPPTPVSPAEHSQDQLRRPSSSEKPPPVEADTTSQPAALTDVHESAIPRAKPRPLTGFSMTAFTLTGFLSDAGLLFNLLGYLSFYDWIILFSVTKQVRTQLQEDRDLREEVLERYLETIGYERWGWDEKEPLCLSLRDLHEYMRGVSLPNHQYARLAEQYLQFRKNGPVDNKSASAIVRDCYASTIAYTRVVVRLRLQAEAAEADYIAQHIPEASHPVSAFARANSKFSGAQSRDHSSRPSSRAPSPAMSMFSQSHHGHSAVASHIAGGSEAIVPQHRGAPFRSPLFKLRRAPLLRVFVPSPDGDWLSDSNVLECEAQLKRAGVSKLLRSGDVVWDVAIGDEGNVGRMVWDGNFLIDLDYSYSPAGDVPQYLHTLAFPPSYFHRVIRTGPANGPHGSNPVVHINISPWGEQIASNLQLLQDRMRTETPQGSHRKIVRWVHRSSFIIRPPPAPIAARYGPNRTRIPPARIAIPQTDLYVDPGWYGTVVVEAEGTNEGLADLQERCGTGIFPPRPKNVIRNPGNLKPRDGRKVFRLMREKSRPGEIWLRAVGEKERLM